MIGSWWRRWVHGERRLYQRPEWPEFAGLDWPDRIMQVNVSDRFHAKQGRSTGRWKLRSGDRQLAVYLKRHYRLPLWQRLLASLWPEGNWSPGMQEKDNLDWAQGAGLEVPEVVAAVEWNGPWGRLQSCLAVEELSDMLPLHEAIPAAQNSLAPDAFRRWKTTLAGELARMARLMHRRRRFHKDLYLCHFFVREEDIATPPASWQGRVSLIDLHRLNHHPLTWPVWLVKDLAQLLYSSHQTGVDARDRLAFWRAYHGTKNKQKWLGRLVVFKCRNYLRHNLKHM